MESQPVSFGIELRRRRLGAGLSLADLARKAHYSKTHLSKVETGAKAASADMAKRCDSALGCNGELAALVKHTERSVRAPASARNGETWTLVMPVVGGGSFAVTDAPTNGTGIVAAASLSLPPASTTPADLASLRLIFDETRKLGQRMASPALIPSLVTNTRLLQTMARHARSGTRETALVLAARFAEFAGWMAQEDGDEDGAEWWTDLAVTLAAEGGDRDMEAYALVRRGLIALYRHDAVTTVELAARAQSAQCSPRVLGLAAQREAQGHAIGGNYDACFRALDRAAVHLQEPSDDGLPLIGTSNVADPVAITRGWCLFDLGQTGQAAAILQDELSRIPELALRARARYGARLSLALAASGEIDAACAAAEPVLGSFNHVGSATIRADLRDLSRELNRRHGNADVRRTMPQLTAALHRPRVVPA